MSTYHYLLGHLGHVENKNTVIDERTDLMSKVDSPSDYPQYKLECALSSCLTSDEELTKLPK